MIRPALGLQDRRGGSAGAKRHQGARGHGAREEIGEGAEDHQREQGRAEHVAEQHLTPAGDADRLVGRHRERQHEQAEGREDREHRHEMDERYQADRPGNRIAQAGPYAAPDQQIELDRQRNGKEVGLHRKPDAGHQADGDGGASGRLHALGARHRSQQIRRASHEHQMLALSEMFVGQHHEQEEQHRRQQRLGECMIGGRHQPDQAPASEEGSDDPGHHPGREPERHAAGQQAGRQHRQGMDDEGEGQVLVDDVDIEPLARQPAAGDVEDRAHVVIDRREEIARQPQHRQREQRHQQQLLDTRRKRGRFFRDGWQGAGKIS